jgi:phosphatidylinositol kinase/protein kinase (PI-3  family)
MHVPDVHNRFGILLEQYLRNCGEHRTALGHQVFVLQKLDEVALRLTKTEDSKPKRLTVVREGLADIVFPSKFRLPLLPEYEFSGLIVDKCRYMNSKKLPLWLDFKIAEGTSSRNNVMLMYKTGDDLRQDQLTLQVLRIMDDLWKKEGLDLRMLPYGCVSTGDQQGMLEIVPNAETIGGIIQSEVLKKNWTGLKAKVEAAKGVLYETEVIKKWLETQSFAAGHGRVRRKALENENDKKAPVYSVKNGLLDTGYVVEHNSSEYALAAGAMAVETFARSCAGYCVATYVLGIGDRHNDNIMLTRDGRFFHIDFGHFLGNFKSKYGVKRERATFVFTPHFAEVLGGVDGAAFKHFVDLSCRAFNILRKHRNMLITLFSLMLSCGIPELQEPENILYLRNMLMPGATDREAAKEFSDEIIKCMNTKTTLLNDVAHVLRVAG